MQHATFKQLLNKNVFGIKIFHLFIFAALVAIPTQKIHAASFSCIAKDIRPDLAVLTIKQNTTTYTFSNAGFVIADVDDKKNLKPVDVISPASYNTQQNYGFHNLKPLTSYSVFVIPTSQSSNTTEAITDCDFTTKAAVATTSGAGLATQQTQTPAVIPASTSTPNQSSTTITNGTIPPLVPVSSSSSKGMGLIPCDGGAGDECDLNSLLQLANNIMSFFFNTILLPLVIIMIMYLGYSYIAAMGKPGQHAKLGSMAKHLVLGLLLMLCAWVIVRTIISVLGYHDDLYFFQK
ncbi:MAG: hypothetical protein ABIO57_03260 [Candidatus Paceibacterota bacterium]